MRKVTCVFLLLSIVATLWSQTKVWTLKECMEYAVQNNTRVSSQEARNKIHTQNYREAVARLLPSVEADVSANFNFGRGLDSETNTYTDINSFGNTYGISSGVVLFDGLAGITRARIQKVNALLGKHQLQEAKDLTAYETMEAFFNSLYYREMVELARQQWQESSKNLQRTQRMEELGLKASPDVAELAAKEAADSYNLTRQKNLLQISIIHLKEKMYFPIEEELQIAGYDTLEMVAKTEDSPIDIYQHALLFLPTAQVANASLRVGELSYRATKGLLLPTLTAHGGISTGFARFMDGSEYIPFSEQFKNKRGYYVGFSLSLPIFDGLARVSNLKRSKQEQPTYQPLSAK
jgi:outer membrane protein